MPTPNYLNDDAQYFKHGPEMGLDEEISVAPTESANLVQTNVDRVSTILTNYGATGTSKFEVLVRSIMKLRVSTATSLR